MARKQKKNRFLDSFFQPLLISLQIQFFFLHYLYKLEFI